MPIRRRDFIYWTGLTSLTFNPLIKSFGQRTTYKAGENYVKVIGILPDTQSIGPKGFHLRWLPPLHKGLPQFTYIYRMPVADLSRLNMKSIVEQAKKGCPAVEKIGDRIATIDTSFLYKKDFFDKFLFDNKLEQLLESTYFNYYFPKKPSVREAAFKRLLEIDPAKNVSNIEYIIRLAWALHYNSGQDSNHNPSAINVRSAGNKVSLNGLNLLYYAALDPTIAQLLGLYYVDENFQQAGNFAFQYTVVCVYPDKKEYGGCLFPVFQNVFANTPQLDEPLRVDQLDPCSWHFDNLVDNPVLHCRTGLKWKNPIDVEEIFDGDMEKYKRRFVNPALYEMFRDGDKWPDLVKNILDIKVKTNPDGKMRDRKDDFNYTDNKIPLESKINYELTGIDLFGQQSKPIKDGLALKNNLPPASPVNLFLTPRSTTAYPKKPPEPEKAVLEFEYGPYQYMQSPDITRFVLYFKKGPLQTNREIAYEVLNNTPVSFEDDSKKYEIHFPEDIYSPGNSLTNPARFPYHRIRLIKDESGNPLPAMDRRTMSIHSFKSGRALIAMGDELITTPFKGRALLERDSSIPLFNTHNFKDWQKVGTPKNIVQPISFSISQSTVYHNEPAIDTRKFMAVCKKALLFIEPEDRAALAPTSKRWMILFIDRPIHESGLFTKGNLIMDSSQFEIAFQAAGKKAGDDLDIVLNDPNLKFAIKEDYKNSHAQIWLEMGNSTLAPENFNNKTIFLTPKLYVPVDTLNLLQGLILLRLQRSGSFNNNLNSKGDILFKADITVNKTEDPGTDEERPATITKNILSTAKLVSDIYSFGSYYYALARLNRNITRINSGTIVLFPGYAGDSAFDLEAMLAANPLPDGEVKRQLFFAIAAEKTNPESTQTISTLSQPVQYTQFRNTKPTEPHAPFPCDSTDISVEQGYVSLPDSRGMSAFKLCWNYPVSGYRFEVARASAQTILTEHHKLWLAGIPEEETLTPLNTPALEGIMFSASQLIKNGILEATLTNTSVVDKKYLNGRIFHSINYFQILKIIDTGSPRKLWLKPSRPASVFSISPGYKLQAVPDYPTIINNDVTLKDMGNACPNAFGIVTGTPVRALEFNDFLPGKGTGKYFYKVRAVDAAENFSEWSPASVGIYQLDTKPPEAPLNFSVEIGDSTARLLWKKEELSHSFERFEVFKFETEQNQNFNNAYAAISKDQNAVKKVRAMLGSITIPRTVIIPIIAVDDTQKPLEERIAATKAAIPITIETTEDNTNLYINPADFHIVHQKTDDETAIVIKTIICKSGKVADGIPLKVTIANVIMESDENWVEFFDRGLVGGNSYYFSARRVNKIRYSLNNMIQEREIKSIAAPAIKVMSIDKSIPEKPVIQRIDWIKDQVSSVDFVPGSRPRFRIVVTTKPDKVLFQKKKSTADKWEVLSIEILNGTNIDETRGYVNWNSDLLIESFTEANVYDIGGYDYKVSIIGMNKISSPYSETVTK